MLYNKQKRLNNEYIQKLCTLLNTNDKQYTLKRTHLNELEYKIDDNNNLYLTGLKFNNIDNPKKKYNDEEIMKAVYGKDPRVFAGSCGVPK